MPRMPTRTPATLMAALGFPKHVDRLHQQLLGHSGRELVSVAAALLQTPEELMSALEPLCDAGVVRVEESRVFVASAPEVVARILAAQAASAAIVQAELESVAAALPFLTGSGARPAEGEVHDVQPLDGEISSGGNPVPLLTALMVQSRGDLLWLRPDQWRHPSEDAMGDFIGGLVSGGRSSRAIYPVRALTEARATLNHRVEKGEVIRVLPTVPTRMFIIGTTHAVLPEPLGQVDEPRSLIRQPGLVKALTYWFEALWDRAAPVSALTGEAEPRSDMQRFLVQQLASGSQDEQIARRLGVSLRTVRRRVADLMIELGAESRFQAGVEAARRGWL